MHYLSVKNTKNGKGVFADKILSKDERIIEFSGSILSKDNMPSPYKEHEDHYVQIGKDLYMGPSGGMDDFINHSCNPNAGILICNNSVQLVAIREINPNEEVTWDYSTTMDEDDWQMDCFCNSKLCREKIKDFKYLDEHIQQSYILLGIVPEFILKNRSLSNFCDVKAVNMHCKNS